MTLVAFDVDGVLIDVRPSFLRIVREVSGATDDDVRRFKAHGGFNDDWELARAAKSWIAAGRPDVLGRVRDWRGVVELCGNDPGDLSPLCIELYRGTPEREGYWRHERVLVEGALLSALSARFDVAACTGRDAWEAARAEELLGFSFSAKTTAEHARKPDPRALLRLCDERHDPIVMLGDTEADRLCARAAAKARGRDVWFYEVTDERPARALVEAFLEASDVPSVAARLCEPAHR